MTQRLCFTRTFPVGELAMGTEGEHIFHVVELTKRLQFKIANIDLCYPYCLPWLNTEWVGGVSKTHLLYMLNCKFGQLSVSSLIALVLVP